MANRPLIYKLVRIRGRVQGVGYRDWTLRRAKALGLTGWVRNCRDGSVEALFVGKETAITDMISACRVGPALARVDRIDEQAVKAPGSGPGLTGFCRLPTV